MYIAPTTRKSRQRLFGILAGIRTPSLNPHSISQRGLLQELIGGMASQERPANMCIRDENASQTNASASFLQGLISKNLCAESEDDLQRWAQTNVCNANWHVPTLNNSCLPSRHISNSPSASSLPSKDREASALRALDTSLSSTFEEKVAYDPVFRGGSKLMQPSAHALQAPPGFSNVKNDADVRPWSMQESSVPSLNALGSYLPSMKPSASQLSRFGNEALSRQRDPATGLLRTEVPSIQRVRSMGCIEAEKFSLPRVPSNRTSGGESLFADDFISKRDSSFEDFAALSSVGTPGSGNALSLNQHDQLTFIPDGTREREDTQLNHLEQQKLHVVDHNLSEASSFVAGERAAHHHGGTQTCNIPRGYSESCNTAEVFAQVRQKRLALLKLENNLLSQLVELNLRDQLLPMKSNDCPTALSSNTSKHMVRDIVCRYYVSGKCIRGNACPFLHPHKSAGTGGLLIDESAMSTLNSTGGGVNVMSCNEAQRCRDDEDLLHLSCDTRTRMVNSHQAAFAKNFCTLTPQMSQPLAKRSPPILGSGKAIITSLDDLQGHMCNAAKDPHLSRFLQAKVTEGKSEDVERIFQEIIKADVVELTMDPYANYLIQKLVDVCSLAQYKGIFNALCRQSNLITLSLSVHGTRVIQKLIERLKTREQRCLMVFLLQSGTVRLSKDPCGNHVVQKCVQYVGHEDCQVMYDAVLSHCKEIASDRYGCLVLQRCLDFGSSSQRKQLVDVISDNAIPLAQHPFGNYAVQHVCDLNLLWASKGVISKLKGKFLELSMQKCSSNVVQKCLKIADEDDLAYIVKELMETSAFTRMLDHPFANYVIQSALGVTKGALHSSLVQAILPYISELRNSAYGKRVLSCLYMRPSITQFSSWE